MIVNLEKDVGLEPTRRSETLHVLPRTAASPRMPVERFIEDQFLDRFGSVISEHYPTLLSLQNEAGGVLATLGLRSAAGEPLFLEHYFDEPIEHVIGQTLGVLPARTDILEIGSLASVGRGASARLVAAAAVYLASCQLLLCRRHRDRWSFGGCSALSISLGVHSDPHEPTDCQISADHGGTTTSKPL